MGVGEERRKVREVGVVGEGFVGSFEDDVRVGTMVKRFGRDEMG